MNRLTRILTLSILTALIAACDTSAPTDPEADVQAILDLYGRWDEAVEASSITGYTAVLDEEVRLVLPGAPDVVGRDNYAAFLGNVLPIAQYRLTTVGEIAVEILGDHALAEYHKQVDMALHDTDNSVSEAGALTATSSVNKYVDVLKRQDDGSWRVYQHAWTTSEHPVSQ